MLTEFGKLAKNSVKNRNTGKEMREEMSTHHRPRAEGETVDEGEHRD